MNICQHFLITGSGLIGFSQFYGSKGRHKNNNNLTGTLMGYKTTRKSPSFSDLELSRQEAKNNTLATLTELEALIEWQSVENLLLQSYPVGRTNKGPQAWSPLLLFKCLLLRNWFRISSDAELVSLINDRFSFKKFIGLPAGDPAPDSSTFSRFRNRITQELLEDILANISDQLSGQRIIVTMGNLSDIRMMRPKKISPTPS